MEPTTALIGGVALDVAPAPYHLYVPTVLHDVPARPTYWESPGTLVFADVSGFTRLSERLARQGRIGAEQLVTTISTVFTGLLSATRDGGDVLKFGGDALLILYTGPDHAARACHAAQGMQRALREVGRIDGDHGRVRLRMSVGIHSGTFPFFLVGDQHLELVVTGPDATRTVETEAAADAAEVLLSPATAAAMPTDALGGHKPPGRLLRRAPSMDPVPTGALGSAAAASLEPYIPLLLRGRLGAESAEHEHRQVTVSFVHFAGVDEVLVRQGAAEVFDRLQALAEVVEHAATELGVCILTTDIGPDGGKYYLAAGAPDAGDDDAGRMLRLCRRIVDADVGLALRAGVNRGHVFGGDVGAPFRRTYSVMGDTVNLAARIMGKAPFGAVLAERSVLSHARANFDTEHVPPFTVKGKTRPIDAALVHAVRPEGRTQRSTADDLPLVGRQAECDRLVRAAQGARDGRGRVVDLVGDAGIGKSRLVRELIGRAEGLRVIEVGCDPTDRLSPYMGSRILLRRILGISLRATDEDAGQHVARCIDDVAPELAAWAPLVATAAGGTLPTTDAVRQLAPQFRGDATRRALADLLAVVLGPTLVVIEDAFWMDDASADALVGALAAAADHPWLVVLTRRAEPSGLHPGLGFSAERLALEPLTGADADRLTEALTEDAPVTPARREELARRADGNPLFLIELLEAHQRGDDALPGSVEGVLAARIDALTPSDRAALRFVSVFGARFSSTVLDRSFGPLGIASTQTDRWQRLAPFVARDRSGNFRFRHDLVREVAYEGLTFRRRQELHARVADTYERLARETRSDHSALLAVHFHRARMHERAYPYARAAAERARDAYANTLAAQFYEQALEAAERLDLPTCEILSVTEHLGDVLEVAGSYDEASAAYRRARTVAFEAADRIRIMRKQGRLQERRGEVTNALRWYGRGLAAADRITDPVVRRRCQGQLRVAYAVARFRQGWFRRCLELCARAVEDAEAADDLETLAYALYVWDATRVQLEPTEQPTNFQRALTIYERLGDLLGQANVLDNLGVHAYYRGDWNLAAERYEQSRQAARRAGDVVGAAVSTMNLGEILVDQGRHQDAEREVAQARVVLRGAGYAVGGALCDAYLGRTYTRSGRVEEGFELLERAARELEDLGSRAQALEARIRTVEPLLALGRLSEAASRIAACVAATAADQNPALRTMALRLQALVHAQQGDGTRAEAFLGESLAAAREAGLRYEIALALRALVDCGLDRDGSASVEAEGLLHQLGVVTTS